MSRGGKDAVEQCKRIAAAVAAQHGVSYEALTGASRHRSLVEPRFVAVYLCRTCTEASLPEIGKAMGGRDHTTALHAYRRVLNDDRLRSLAAQYQGAAIRAMYGPSPNPGHPDGSWTGDMRVVTGYLAEQHANMGDDGRFIVTGAPVKVSGRSVEVPADTVFYRGARPYPLAYGLAVYEMRRLNPSPTPDALADSLARSAAQVREQARVLIDRATDGPAKNMVQQLEMIAAYSNDALRAADAHRDGWFASVDRRRRAAYVSLLSHYLDAAMGALALAAEGGMKNTARRRDAVGIVADVYEEDQQGLYASNPCLGFHFHAEDTPTVLSFVEDYSHRKDAV